MRAIIRHIIIIHIYTEVAFIFTMMGGRREVFIIIIVIMHFGVRTDIMRFIGRFTHHRGPAAQPFTGCDAAGYNKNSIIL